MKKAIQAIMVVPISETIGRAVGGNRWLGTGVAMVVTRLALRSFCGMVVLAVAAGAINLLERRRARPPLKVPASPRS